MLVKILLTGEKNGVKRKLLVDEHGIPLSIVVCGANRHDVKKLGDLLEAKVYEAPYSEEENLCLDGGYVGEEAHLTTTGYGYNPHVRPRGEEKGEIKKNPEFKPRRWIVEVAHSWFNRFRKILIRYEKKSKNYLALLHLAASIICWRKIGVIYG